jgi:3-hydroxyacyl-CoA dehydrogenase
VALDHLFPRLSIGGFVIVDDYGALAPWTARGEFQVEFLPDDMVIEAATERLALKQEILGTLSRLTEPHVILASNTSSISITTLAAATDRPEKVVGMHFMNPVPVMQLVELIRGLQTSDETFAATKALAEKMGKTTVVGRDMPGFIVNRILMPFLAEAMRLYEEGTGSAEDIEWAYEGGSLFVLQSRNIRGLRSTGPSYA